MMGCSALSQAILCWCTNMRSQVWNGAASQKNPYENIQLSQQDLSVFAMPYLEGDPDQANKDGSEKVKLVWTWYQQQVMTSHFFNLWR